MEIKLKKISELNSLIEVQITEPDYKEKFEQIIRDFKKKATVPGFRPGKVPADLIRKLHGKSILQKEVGKLVTDKVNEYIRSQNLNLISDPIPSNGNNETVPDNNWDQPSDFHFSFEIGLKPDFDLNLKREKPFVKYNILMDDQTFEEEMKDLCARNGKTNHPEESAEEDYLYVTSVKIESDKETDSRQASFLVYIPEISDAEIKSRLAGRKINDEVELNVRTLVNHDEKRLAHIFSVSADEVRNLPETMRLRIRSITRVDKAELDQKLFDSVYGKDIVKNKEDFLFRYKEDFLRSLRREAYRRFEGEIIEFLLSAHPFPLPVDFLRRWLKYSSEEEFTEQKFDREYKSYERNLRYILIENKILAVANLFPSEPEIRDEVNHFLSEEYGKMEGDEGKKFYDHVTDKYLADPENRKRIYNLVGAKKVKNHILGINGAEEKEISYPDFKKTTSNQ